MQRCKEVWKLQKFNFPRCVFPRRAWKSYASGESWFNPSSVVCTQVIRGGMFHKGKKKVPPAGNRNVHARTNRKVSRRHRLVVRHDSTRGKRVMTQTETMTSILRTKERSLLLPSSIHTHQCDRRHREPFKNSFLTSRGPVGRSRLTHSSDPINFMLSHVIVGLRVFFVFPLNCHHRAGN